MTDHDHFKLDERSDDGPRRNIWGAFSQQDSAKQEGAWDQGRKAAGAAGEAWTNAITDTVGLANRIITEQIELGKKVASQLNNQVYGFGDYANAPQDLAETVLRSVTELSTGWLKLMTDMSSMFAGGPSDSNGHSNGSTAASSYGDVQLDTSRQAQIAAHLSGLTPSSQLIVSPLISEVADRPALTEFQTSGYRPFITVSVPDDQPAGLYFGAVFDRSQRKVLGWIMVTVLDSPQSAGTF